MLRSLVFVGMLSAVIPAAPALAKVAAAPAAPNPDPWESANRGLYKLNQGLDRAVVRPGAVFYHHALSHSIREGVHNVLYNLGEPVTFVNDVLQVRPGKAGQSAVRFVVNSTVGIGGVFDVTGGQGLQREPSGFAQTLTRYGAPQGPYIFIPIFGPSSVRDLSGRVADAVTDPFTWINYGARPYVQAARSVLGGIDQRVALDPVLKDVNLTATDPYATLRSAFLQSSSITGDSVKDAKALPDFNAEPPPASSNPPHQ